MAGNPNDPSAGVFTQQPPQGGFGAPTEPLPPNHPAAIKPVPDHYTQRLTGLSKAHPWMPKQTVATLAALPASDQAVSQMAADLRQTYGTVDNAVKYVTDDPLLQKTPSLAMYLRSYLTNTLGASPVAAGDLVQVQRNLQQQGWGKGLKANGEWNGEWNSAFSQWSDDLRSQALGGKQPGSIPFSEGLAGLAQIMPKESATSIGAWLGHLPDDFQKDLHTMAGAVTGGAVNLATGFEPKNLLNLHEKANVPAEESAESSVENALTFTGPKVTPQTSFSAQGGRTQAMDVLQVAGDLLATHGLLRAGSAVADASAATKWTSLDDEAARRGPGVVASKMFGHAGTEAGTATKGAIPLLSKEAANNVPILRMTGPVADKIAGGEGYYYRARSLLAAPYAVPGVKVAGTAVGQFGLAGAKIRGAASLESAVGGQQSPETQAIAHFQAVNQLNDAIGHRLQFTAWGHHFQPGLDTLAWVLHPPLDGQELVSQTVGKDVSGLNDTVQSAFGPTTGFGLSIERGVNWTRHGDQKLTYQQMVQAAGGPGNFAQFWSSKIYQHAATYMAEKAYNALDDDEKIARGTNSGQLDYADRSVAIKSLADEYMDNATDNNDWETLQQGVKAMMTDDNPMAGQWGGHNGLAKRIAAEIQRSGTTPKDWLKSNVANHAAGSKIMREEVVPRMKEIAGDDVPPGTVGMARLDYLTQEQAHKDADNLEANYNTAKAATQPAEGEQAPPDAWKNRETAADAIRTYLTDKYGIDGLAMPQDDEDMIKLLRQKAGGQARRVFPRTTGHPTMPDEPETALRPTAPQHGGHTLDRSIPGSAYTNMTPAQATKLIHEDHSDYQHAWVNDRSTATKGQGGTDVASAVLGGGVVVEHDPAALYGERDGSQGSEFANWQGRVGHFLASRDYTHGLKDVRSIEFRPVKGESEAQETARELLMHHLDQQTETVPGSENPKFVKFDLGKGVTRYVREDLTGGIIPTSPQLARSIGKLKDLGYMPVLGKGIGYDFYKSPLLDVADSHLTVAKRFLERLGLSPENIPSTDIGFTWNMEFMNRLLAKVEKYNARIAQPGEDAAPKAGELKLYPTHTVQTVAAMMRDRDNIPADGGVSTAIAKTIGRRAYNTEFNMRVDELMEHGIGEQQAQQTIARRMQQELENPLGLVHVTKSDLRDALSQRPSVDYPPQAQMARAAELRDIKTGARGAPMYDEKAINEIYRTIQEANGAMPARLVGWQKAENLTALGLSYAGRPIPGSIGRAIEYLPTRLVTLRNRARFTLSPEFAARRVVKVNFKMSMDGVPPTLHPMRMLMKGGESNYHAAMARLDRIMPEMKNPEYDEGTQALYANDPWGIYNHRNYEAYAAQEWAKQGKTDTEIRQLITKDFGYGSEKYGEGRSALERSANFVFFPLSFDKTLYRNTGAYLLDHVAQRMILQAGLEAYNRYNQSDPDGNKLMSSNWWLNHAPVINEALRLNAFAHGIGLGEFGGINAPLLNLFIPQSYASSSQGLTLLKGIMPIVKQFQNIASETTQTFQVSRQLFDDQFIHNPSLAGFRGKEQSQAQTLQAIFDAKPVAEDTDAQLTQAYQYRRKLTTLMQAQIDYNAHHTTKLKLGSQSAVFGQWTGHTIDATLVDYLTAQKFPAFQPSDPAIYYAKEAQSINEFSQRMKTSGHAPVVTWINQAQSVGTAIYDGKLDTAQSTQFTRIYRQYAIRYAETIPGFLTFYNANFRWQFGPLESVR